MRISRPCYDKMHRCPGWAGGGLRYAAVDRCDSGRLVDPYEGRFWHLKVHRCDTCDVVVLPWVIKWLDPSWLRCQWSLRGDR